jgi:preprotein translocase subunit YajC
MKTLKALSIALIALVPVFAMAAPAAQVPVDTGMFQYAMLAVFGLVFYFLIWRPQSKRQKDHKNLMGALSVGDEVVTGGGLIGKITKITEDFIAIEIAKDTEIKVQKHFVTSTLPKGTIKSI